MSKEIDWSKAPADAQAGACGGYRSWGSAWYKQVNGQWFCLMMNEPGDTWTPNDGPCGRTDLQLRPMVWSGEGLPPVGTICEFRISASDDWNVVEVRYMSEMTALLFFRLETGCSEGAYCPKICMFRPIKTAEQIEAEERDKTINGIVDILAGLWSSEVEAAEFLYNAGYRKVSK